jgi:two-component system LytT family response regulator
MVRIIVLEDEKPVLETITEIVKNHCEETELIGVARNIRSAKEIIQKSNPDLVLLDINLPDGTSFELLEQLKTIDFKIIFITAFEEFAIKAIKLSAIDYLVKPIDPIELIEAIKKAQEAVNQANNNLKLNALLSNVKGIANKTKKIILKTAENIHLIDVNDIMRCESDGAYTRFYLNDGKKIMISKVIKDYEEMLHDYGFLRVHKSHIINLNFIDRFEKSDGGSVILKDQSSIPVSVRKKESLLKIFEELSR